VKDLLEYKGYYGSAEFSIEDEVFHGKLLFITSLVTYEADEAKALKKAFEAAVEDYLQLCQELKRKPEKPCKGSFNVRLDPELHRQLSVYANQKEITLNSLVEQGLTRFMEGLAGQSTRQSPVSQRRSPQPKDPLGGRLPKHKTSHETVLTRQAKQGTAPKSTRSLKGSEQATP
jgi:predicted HicB family RNase H-like nuclease